MAASAPCSALCPQLQGSELWITYHQASRSHKQVTAQLVDVSDAAQLFDLEDVLDYVFQQGFVDPKWRSVTWWEDCSALRLKSSSTVQDLLARGAGSTPETSLHLIVGTWRVFWIRLKGACWILTNVLMQRTCPRPSGSTTNTCTPYTRTPRPSASVLTCPTSSVSVWRTSRTTSLPRVISRPTRVLSYPGRVHVGSTSRRAPRLRTCSPGARVIARESPCASSLVSFLRNPIVPYIV